jgi:hypothetical protein
MAWIPIDSDYIWNYSTCIEIGKDWYSVGNTEYDIFTLKFKDFIRMVNFFWVMFLSVMVLDNRYIWIL